MDNPHVFASLWLLYTEQCSESKWHGRRNLKNVVYLSTDKWFKNPTCPYQCTICPYFNKYKCKYFNKNVLMNALKCFLTILLWLFHCNFHVKHFVFYLIFGRTSQLENVTCPEQQLYDSDNTDNWFRHPCKVVFISKSGYLIDGITF